MRGGQMKWLRLSLSFFVGSTAAESLYICIRSDLYTTVRIYAASPTLAELAMG